MPRGTRWAGRVVLLAFAGACVFASSSALAAGKAVTPKQTNMLDCNGLSQAYSSVVPTMRSVCTDPVAKVNGKYSRFEDNGTYIGHDEPSVKFISSAHGSGNTMTYRMQLAVDPKKTPTPDGRVTDYAELSVAPWFGLPMCDPSSFPQGDCIPDSDQNDPNVAGSAFMELQFYAPGFGPWEDAISCDQTKYCSALNIDSLSCTADGSCNDNCIEPVNFAWLQRDGVPAGPPSPQLADESTFVPNSQTLMMNPGDTLEVSISDQPAGFTTTVRDLTTGQSGTMTASAANGFMNTDAVTCNGTPHTFHAEYDTAAQQNQVPWAALEGGVLMQQEIGHFESCDSVTNTLGIPFDPQTFQTCVGGIEKGTGEGPCTASGCTGSTTEGGGPCPSADSACEFSDANCVPSGPRPVTQLGVTKTWTWAVAGCVENVFQNGDLDFDGNSYLPDWPDGSPNHPTPFRYTGPLDANGNPYPQIQFETNVAASENDCDTVSGAGCTALPRAAAFYPFWTLGQVKGGPPGPCAWSFGDDIHGTTSTDFGKTGQYGVPNVARFAGTLTSPVMPNPQLATDHCRPNGNH